MPPWCVYLPPPHHITLPDCLPPWRRSHSALPTLGLVAGSGGAAAKSGCGGGCSGRRRAGRPARRAHAGCCRNGRGIRRSEPPLGADGPEPCARDVAGRWAQAVGAGGGAGGGGGGGGQRLQQPAPRLRLLHAVGTTDLTDRPVVLTAPASRFLPVFYRPRVCVRVRSQGTVAAAGCCSSPAAAAVAGRWRRRRLARMLAASPFCTRALGLRKGEKEKEKDKDKEKEEKTVPGVSRHRNQPRLANAPQPSHPYLSLVTHHRTNPKA